MAGGTSAAKDGKARANAAKPRPARTYNGDLRNMTAPSKTAAHGLVDFCGAHFAVAGCNSRPRGLGEGDAVVKALRPGSQSRSCPSHRTAPRPLPAPPF